MKMTTLAVSSGVSPDEAESLALMFGLLGDPNRVRIVHALVDVDERNVGEIAEVCDVTPTVVSHTMRLLRTAGFVRSRREGRAVHYRLDDEHVRTLLQTSLDHLRHQQGEYTDG